MTCRGKTRKRRAFTLIELLVVIALVSLLAGVLFPVFVQAREKARQTACLSNLKQIAAALALYRQDYDGVNCRYRSCPDKTGDTTCTKAKATEYTGPNESWWAAYDSFQLPEPLDPDAIRYAGPKAGMLMPYVQNLSVFRCPSYPQGQVGYAMSYIYGGPMGQPDSFVTNPSVYFVWEHARTPGCADTSSEGDLHPAMRGPFPFALDTMHTHYPHRHANGFIGLRYDGSAKFRKPSSLTNADFAAQTP